MKICGDFKAPLQGSTFFEGPPFFASAPPTSVCRRFPLLSPAISFEWSCYPQKHNSQFRLKWERDYRVRNMNWIMFIATRISSKIFYFANSKSYNQLQYLWPYEFVKMESMIFMHFRLSSRFNNRGLYFDLAATMLYVTCVSVTYTSFFQVL